MGKTIKIIANIVGIVLGIIYTFSLAPDIGRSTPTLGLFILTVPIIWAFYCFPQWVSKSNKGKIINLFLGILIAFVGKYFVHNILLLGSGIIWILN